MSKKSRANKAANDVVNNTDVLEPNAAVDNTNDVEQFETTELVDGKEIDTAPLGESDTVIGTEDAIIQAATDGVITPTEADAAIVIPARAKTDDAADPTVYTRTDFVRPVRKGFETVLLNALNEGPGTAAEILKRLTDNGEYNRVAPQAFALRPYKPLVYLLKAWTEGKLLTASASAPEPVPADMPNPDVLEGVEPVHSEEAAA